MRTLFPGTLADPFCRSPCSDRTRLRARAWPFTDPRCHLQISPFKISWMCCTMRLMATGGNQKKTSWVFLTLQRAGKCWNVFIFLKKKHSPILSTPLGMMTSAYFLVWEEQNVFRNKCNVCLLNRIGCWTNKHVIGADHHTYRQTKLFKGWLHKCCILTENLLQISPSAHVSQNYRRGKKEGKRIWCYCL